MDIAYLLYLLLRFVTPVPVVEMPEPQEIVMEPQEIVEEAPAIIEKPTAYIHTETGATIYLEEGQDGTDVDLADLD